MACSLNSRIIEASEMGRVGNVSTQSVQVERLHRRCHAKPNRTQRPARSSCLNSIQNSTAEGGVELIKPQS